MSVSEITKKDISDRKPACGQDDVRSAAEAYAKENPEIQIAIEAMRRSQLVQESRVRSVFRHSPYYFGE